MALPGDNTPTRSLDHHRCQTVVPEFLRISDAVRVFCVGKSTLADWIANGFVRSHLIRRRGNVSGIRLISTESLREFIESHGPNGKLLRTTGAQEERS